VLASESYLQIYKQIQAEPELQDLAPQQTPEQILQCPIKYIRNWATQSVQQVQTYAIAMHKQAILHTQDICRFFSVQTSQRP